MRSQRLLQGWQTIIPLSSPTFSVRPRSLVGRVTADLIRRSWVRFSPRSKDFFFTSCGSLIPFTRVSSKILFLTKCSKKLIQHRIRKQTLLGKHDVADEVFWLFSQSLMKHLHKCKQTSEASNNNSSQFSKISGYQYDYDFGLLWIAGSQASQTHWSTRENGVWYSTGKSRQVRLICYCLPATDQVV